MTQSTIDYIATNISCFTYSVFDGNIADHLVCCLEFSIKKGCVAIESRVQTRNTSMSCLLNFSAFLSDVDWVELDCSYSTVDQMFSVFMNKFLYFYNLACPYVSRGSGDVNRVVWVTPEIIRSGRALKDLFWLVKNGFSELRNIYIEEKKRHNMLIESTKSERYKLKINSSSNKSRALWGCVRQQLGVISNGNVAALNVAGVLVSRPDDICNSFCAYFTDTVPRTLLSTFKSTSVVTCTLGTSNNVTFYFYPMSADKVLTTITSSQQCAC